MGSSLTLELVELIVEGAHGAVPVLSKGPTETLHGSCGREKACFISPPQVASTHSPAMTEQVASTKKRKKISEVNLSI